MPTIPYVAEGANESAIKYLPPGFSPYANTRILSLRTSVLANGGGALLVISDPIASPFVIRGVSLNSDVGSINLWARFGWTSFDMASVNDIGSGQNIVMPESNNTTVSFRNSLPLPNKATMIGPLANYVDEENTRLWLYGVNNDAVTSMSVQATFFLELVPASNYAIGPFTVSQAQSVQSGRGPLAAPGSAAGGGMTGPPPL